MRLQYPTNVKIINVPCSGRVDIIHLLRAIEDGADAVFVAGCLEGECHYISGNLKARKRVNYVKKTLKSWESNPNGWRCSISPPVKAPDSRKSCGKWLTAPGNSGPAP